MAETDKTPATLLDDLAALDPAQRREVAKELQKVAETFAGVPYGRHTAHALGLLPHWLDSGSRALTTGPTTVAPALSTALGG